MSEESLMDVRGVMAHLPHRYPFLLVDRVLALTPGEEIRAIKNVTANEPCFTGHFPGYPIFPGVLILEALAQAGGILAFKTNEAQPSEDELYFLAGFDNVRFRRMVSPGDQLQLDVKVIKVRRDIWKYTGEASVQGELACAAEFMCAQRGASS